MKKKTLLTPTLFFIYFHWPSYKFSRFLFSSFMLWYFERYSLWKDTSAKADRENKWLLMLKLLHVRAFQSIFSNETIFTECSWAEEFKALHHIATFACIPFIREPSPNHYKRLKIFHTKTFLTHVKFLWKLGVEWQHWWALRSNEGSFLKEGKITKFSVWEECCSVFRKDHEIFINLSFISCFLVLTLSRAMKLSGNSAS